MELGCCLQDGSPKPEGLMEECIMGVCWKNEQVGDGTLAQSNHLERQPKLVWKVWNQPRWALRGCVQCNWEVFSVIEKWSVVALQKERWVVTQASEWAVVSLASSRVKEKDLQWSRNEIWISGGELCVLMGCVGCWRNQQSRTTDYWLHLSQVESLDDPELVMIPWLGKDAERQESLGGRTKNSTQSDGCVPTKICQGFSPNGKGRIQLMLSIAFCQGNRNQSISLFPVLTDFHSTWFFFPIKCENKSFIIFILWMWFILL